MPPMTPALDRLNALVALLRPNRRTRILDIGANPINGCPYDLLLTSGHAEVWGFEPQEEAFQALLRKKGQNENYLPHAIGDGRQCDLHISQSDGFTSLLKPNRATLDFLGRWHKAMTVTQVVRLTTRRLDDLDDLPQPDLLKIDVQGAETCIFENGVAKLSQTVAILTEVAFLPLYEGQPLYQEQAAALAAQGFLLHKFQFLKSKTINSAVMSALDWRHHQSQVIDGDAVFLRSLLKPDTYSDEQLKHLAILAGSVFESHDLTLKCLALLIERGVIREEDARGYAAQSPPTPNSNRVA